MLFNAPFQSFGIIGLGIERQCTNIVISWPSQGYEYYLIQNRSTFDPETPWMNLTNNYRANSTNRTTYTIYGVAAPCSGGGGGSLIASGDSGQSVPMVVPKDESRPPVPLGIYPPGMDLTGYVIISPDSWTDEWSVEVVEKWRANQQAKGGPQTADSGGGFNCGLWLFPCLPHPRLEFQCHQLHVRWLMVFSC